MIPENYLHPWQKHATNTQGITILLRHNSGCCHSNLIPPPKKTIPSHTAGPFESMIFQTSEEAGKSTQVGKIIDSKVAKGKRIC